LFVFVFCYSGRLAKPRQLVICLLPFGALALRSPLKNFNLKRIACAAVLALPGFKHRS